MPHSGKSAIGNPGVNDSTVSCSRSSRASSSYRRLPGSMNVHCDGRPVRKSSGRIELGHRPSRAQRALEQPRRALAGGGHVDVRIGAIGDEAVGMLDHRARDVGVQVEARDDGNAGADDLAHAREQLALAVVEMLGDHRAVQVEVDAVDRPGLRSRASHLADDALVRVRGDVRRRRGRAPREARGCGGRPRAAPRARRWPECWRRRAAARSPRRT